jgi:thioredoxin 1
VDVDVEQELAIKYMVQSIPTVIIFKDGQMVGEPHIGLSPKEYYQSQIQNLL